MRHVRFVSLEILFKYPHISTPAHQTFKKINFNAIYTLWEAILWV